MGTLDEKECLHRSRAACLENIRNLNIWGSGLHDISVVQKLVNLEVLNLSVNNVYTLRNLSHCPRMKEIYLRKNKVSDLKEIKFLKNLPNLQILWLADNPCSDNDEDYKYTVLRNLPNLTKLDSNIVTEEDRELAQEKGILYDADAELPCYDGLELDKTLTTEALRSFLKKQKSVNEDTPVNKEDEKVVIIDTAPVPDEEQSKESKLNENEETNSNVENELRISLDSLGQPLKNKLKDQISPTLKEEELINNNSIQEQDLSTSKSSLQRSSVRKSNTFAAVLLLLNDLTEEELEGVQQYVTNELLVSKTSITAESILVD